MHKFMKAIAESKWDHPIESLRPGEAAFDPRPGYDLEEQDHAKAMAMLDRAIGEGTVKDPEPILHKLEKSRGSFRLKEECRCVVRRFLGSPSVYDIDPALHDLLAEAKWKPDILSEFIRLPKGKCIGLAVPPLIENDPMESVGLFLVEDDGAVWGVPEAPRALVVALAPIGVPMVVLPLVDGVPIGEAFDSRLSRQVARGLDAVVRSSGEEIKEDYGLRSFLVRYAINVLLYLLGDRDVVSEVHPGLPESKKNRNKPAFTKRPMEVVRVGKALGDKIRSLERYAEQPLPEGVPGSMGRGKAIVRAHLRSAHFHTYRVGKGRIDLRVHLLATILVNGKEHDLDDLAAEGSVVQVY